MEHFLVNNIYGDFYRYQKDESGKLFKLDDLKKTDVLNLLKKCEKCYILDIKTLQYDRLKPVLVNNQIYIRTDTKKISKDSYFIVSNAPRIKEHEPDTMSPWADFSSSM